MRWRILGCGVSGLTSAVQLAEAGFETEIWARELPPQTTSNVAAAYWHPYRASPRDPVLQWSKRSLEVFRQLAADPTTGVHLAPVLQASTSPYETPWWSDAVPELESVVPRELGPEFADFESGFAFSAPVVDTSRYLPYLMARFRAAGGQIEEREVTSFELPSQGVDGLVNCCGLDARELTEDTELFPIRGEIVRVDNPGIDRVLVVEHSAEGPTYIIPRRDECILGGTALDGIEDRAPDPAAQQGILERCARIEPRVAGLKPNSTAVGLRPGRSQVRVELDLESGPVPIVHNYGHGGAGITLSWGCAEETLRRLNDYSDGSSSTAVP